MNSPYKKSQFGIEFVILLTFMLMVFVGVFAVVTYKLIDLEESRKQQMAEEVANRVNNEIKLARANNDGYERIFELPTKIEGKSYDIRIIENRELVVDYSGYEYVLFLPEKVKGNITTGLNKIQRIDGIVYIGEVVMPPPECNNTLDDDGDTYNDSQDPGCYADCDYLNSANFIIYRSEADSCDCNSVGVCCSAIGIGSHYSKFDGSCAGSECWSGCLPSAGYFLLTMKNSIFKAITFKDDGNVVLKGALQQNSNPQPTADDEFIVKNSYGNNVAIINLVTGNMILKGSLFEDQQALTPSEADSDFIVKGSDGNVVSYIDEAGNFYLKGNLTENGNP
jgi:hypothetical protein